MPVYKTRSFHRWAKKSGVKDDALLLAVAEMRRGLIDADLGGGVVKKRIATAGKGKSGGARTIVATRQGSRWIFMYGFEKKERSNIRNDELAAFRIYANSVLKATAGEIKTLTKLGELLEVGDG